MFKEIAKNRIINLNFKEYGKNEHGKDGDLMFEFLRRMCIFFHEYKLKRTMPLMINVAEVLGDNNNCKQLLRDCCSNDIKWLNDHWYVSSILESYLQLSILADKRNDVAKYLDIYDPLIRLMERGAGFFYKGAYIYVENGGIFPIGKWDEKFLDADVINISEL